MYSPDEDIVTLEDIQNAYKILKSCPDDWYRRTPILCGAQKLFCMQNEMKVYIKPENMQVTGSFKVRGTINMMKHLSPEHGTEQHQLISMSAGNFAKAFAYISGKMGLKGIVLMPDTAAENRVILIQSYGMPVEQMPNFDMIYEVQRHCKEDGMVFLHPFDDIRLIAGHGSLGLEILEDVPDIDIVLLCCGGGGLLSGTAAAIKLSGHEKCKIYGIEPEGVCTMYESFKQGHAVEMPVKTTAGGQSPTFAGTNCYKHCRQFVDDILLVSDDEILTAMFTLYKTGLLVEPSGAAAFAALHHGKVPDTDGKKIVVVITGGNVTPEELVKYSAMNSAST